MKRHNSPASQTQCNLIHTRRNFMFYNINDLKDACNAGEKLKYLFFWGHTPSADGQITEACLSQWWPCRFEVDGIEYSCTEQFMMAEKARMFEDKEMLAKIMEASHPKEMKAYGRAVRGFDKDRWDSQCYDIVKRGNLAKFSQNPDLLEFLKGTRRRILVEASPRDRIWGIGMGKNNPDALNPLKWRGTNLLGFALTEVRDMLLSSPLPLTEPAGQTWASVPLQTSTTTAAPRALDSPASSPEKPVRDRNGLTEEEFLAAYQPGDYPRPSVATDMVIFTVTDEDEENYRKLPEKELCILLIRRGGHPYLGCWALPGGFVRPTETTEDAASRELREETGVDQVYLEQLYTFSQPDRDPRTWVMSCSYMALIDSSQVQLQAGDDADMAAWFKLVCRMRCQEKGKELWELELSHDDILLRALLEKGEKEPFTQCRILENDGLAFDHARIIASGLDRLRGKLKYTDLAIHLMPEYFTLTQLQQVYEAVLDQELPTAAFRRKAASMVKETPHFTENAGHRPSRLYQKNVKG